ncbi:response regulator transcription factor [Flectobacillus sp. DC10W]|uniref:Response regulator transcription factor n=1 Tax=Flectobacillus longus TaxID=2984207 RepID=A0ABT6YTG8_9BACT|nr:response regulator transcription factor [Flectobacillus longus]MDI9866902.1 response regulator transcription factor [Flectobacillus longus]
MNKQLTLLIIDDEQSTRIVLEHFLKKDFNVVVKGDGMEALSLLEEGFDVDFIIADLNMPNLSGKEFLKILRASNLFGQIPVIILSGTDESKERIDCLNIGADDFMLKPFNPMEVQAKIRAIMRRVQPF